MRTMDRSLRIQSVDATDRALLPEEAQLIAESLRSGEVVELTLVTPRSAGLLVEELIALQTAHGASSLAHYCQILIAEGGTILNWGTSAEDHATIVDLSEYITLDRALNALTQISDSLRTPSEHLLLSAVPALRRDRVFTRFYHRESHRSLDQLEREGSSNSIYRMTCDMGLENSCDIINVNLVPRSWLLERDGRIASRYKHLFQRQYFDFRAETPEDVDATQRQLTEAILPFPGTKHDLLPGRAMIWNDDMYFHGPYLKAGRLLSELGEKPRSIMVINEFANDCFDTIHWGASVRDLLGVVIGSDENSDLEDSNPMREE